MSKEDVFSTTTFFEVFEQILAGSLSVALFCVVLIQLLSLWSNKLLFKILSFMLGFLLIYLNFAYFEFFIVFKIPLRYSDILYMEDPKSVWQLAEGSVLNIRFIFFILIPSSLLFLNIFLLKNNTHKLNKLIVVLVLLLIGIRGYYYFDSSSNQYAKENPMKKFGYKRNNLVIVFEAAKNYILYKEDIPEPKSVLKIRSVFGGETNRIFTQDTFPLLQQSKYFKEKHLQLPKKIKNIIIIMFESLPSVEIYKLVKYEQYYGLTPFLSQLVDRSVVFNQAYATGIHTFFGTTDTFIGIPSFSHKSWNRKIDLSFPFSLPNILRKNGFCNVSWYHGGANPHFDNKANFSKSVGFTKTFFYNNFPPEAVKGNWGISDREVFLKAAQEIKKNKCPSMTFILGLTKHGPWNIPPDFDYEGFEKDVFAKDTNFKEENLRNTKKLIYYYDQILKEFFNELEGNKNFEDSLVIITSDQASYPDIRSDSYYHSIIKAYKIPLIFYYKGITPKSYSTVASHLDMIPTIVNLFNLSLPDEVPYTGKNLFSRNKSVVNNNFHFAFTGNRLLKFTTDGFYYKEYSMSDRNLKSKLHFSDKNGEKIVNDKGVETLFDTFSSIYPYLYEKNLVFPSSSKIN